MSGSGYVTVESLQAALAAAGGRIAELEERIALWEPLSREHPRLQAELDAAKARAEHYKQDAHLLNEERDAAEARVAALEARLRETTEVLHLTVCAGGKTGSDFRDCNRYQCVRNRALLLAADPKSEAAG